MAKKPRIPDRATLETCEVCGKLIGAKGYFPTCMGHEVKGKAVAAHSVRLFTARD